MLLRSGIIVTFFTAISRIFGLAREFFIATTFGSSSIGDCVNIAFKLPNLFRRIFGEGALSIVFIPIFNQKLVRSKNEAIIFSGKIFTLLLITLIILSGILQLLMPYFMFVIAPGFHKNHDKFDLVVTLCRITIPYLIFVSLIALLGGILNSIKKFSAFAFAPVIMNICLIIGTLILRPYCKEEYGISISLIISGIFQFIFMYFCIIKAGFTIPLMIDIKDKSVKSMIKNMIPAIMSSGAQQLNLFITQSIASFTPGAISILTYADRLYQLPLALTGITFSTILLPPLSQIYQKKQISRACEIQNQVIQIALIIALPCSVILGLLSKQMVHLIYEHGIFTRSNTNSTASALSLFAIGLPSFILSRILLTIFYANQDTKTPFKITLYYLFINGFLNIILLKMIGLSGIALGSSIASWINLWMLYHDARKYWNMKISNSTRILAFKLVFSATLSAIVLYLFCDHYNSLFYNNNIFVELGMLSFAILIAILIFLISAILAMVHRDINFEIIKLRRRR